MKCPACAADVPAGFRFCGQCGSAVAQSTTPAVDQAERRQLTVVFCDLADSTQLAERIDPEELRDLVRAYQHEATGVVERFAGHVAQYLGDGILVYFGFPRAQEDDPRRAVRASMEIVDRINKLSEGLEASRGIRLAVRIGVHTGLTVAGEVGGGERREQLAMGSTPNVAARIQALATPGSIIVSEATHRLIDGFFECAPLGPKSLKGRAEPDHVFRVVRETGAETLFDVAIARGLSPAVGRVAELTTLDERFADLRAGRGSIVLVQGEAGIGKSRLLQLFRDRVGSGATWILCRGSVDHQTSPLRPIILVVERLFHIGSDDTADARRKKIEVGVSACAALGADAIPILGSLLSVPMGDAYPPLQLGPRLQRARTQEAVVTLLLASGNNAPIVLAAEDLHWVDPSTLDMLQMLGRRISGSPVLLLCTARPEFVPQWGNETPSTVIQLDRLDRDDIIALATSVAGARPLPANLIDQLVAKTDGVPLFVEELTKMVLESGLVADRGGRFVVVDGDDLAIPDTLHDSLIARLDRLGPARGIGQLGSVIGREFTFPMIQAVATVDAATLQAQLTQLVDAGMLKQAGELPDRQYAFKHALIRDAAYNSLLRTTRRQHHQTIAETFTSRFPEMRETEPETLAHHYTEAGLTEPAIDAWIAAGERGAKGGNTAESIAHYRRGIAVLESKPAGVERDRRELGLQIRLGDSMSIALGYASPDVAATYKRAAELEVRIGDDSQQSFDILGGLHRYHFVRADVTVSLEIALQLLERARAKGPLELVIAAYSFGLSRWARGEFDQGLPVLDEALAADVEAWGSPTALRTSTGNLQQGVQVRVALRGTTALTLAHLGQLDRAVLLTEEQLATARANAQPYSIAFSHYSNSMIHYFRRDPAKVVEHAQQMIRVSREHGYFFVTLGSAFLGWGLGMVEIQNGGRPTDESVALISQGLGGYRAAGARASQTLFLAMLAELHLTRGDAALADATLDEATRAATVTQERFWLPDLHRLRAALARSAGKAGDAEAQLRTAMTVAESQGNRLLELRAALDLARIFQERGDQDQARDVVRPTFGTFREGLETADLRAAAALLQH